MEIHLSPSFVINISKGILGVFYSTIQTDFKLGIDLSSFLPAQLVSSSKVLLHCLLLLPVFINSLFLPEFLNKLSVQPGWSSPWPAKLLVNWDSLLLHL